MPHRSPIMETSPEELWTQCFLRWCSSNQSSCLRRWLVDFPVRPKRMGNSDTPSTNLPPCL
jgi:hypothetical protein